MDLKEKFNLYVNFVKTAQDQHGFIMADKCDSLLFSGLIGCVPEIDVNIDAAHNSDGMWWRRPIDLSPCYTSTLTWKDRFSLAWKDIWTNPTSTKETIQAAFETGGSSISRDMFIGLAWNCYHNNRLDISEGVIKYALKHFLIMGKGTPTRTFLTPGLLSTFAWISYRLGGPSRPWLRYIPQFESKTVTGFEAHLSVLHILLRNELTGKVKFGDNLVAQANREPQNPLFEYAIGNKANATKLLMDERWFPNNRPPTNKDRSEPWLLQRDYGKDWLSEDGERKIWSGADFLFCAWLVLNH